MGKFDGGPESAPTVPQNFPNNDVLTLGICLTLLKPFGLKNSLVPWERSAYITRFLGIKHDTNARHLNHLKQVAPKDQISHLSV